MKIPIQVTYIDGSTVEVTTSVLSVALTERRFDQSAIALFLSAEPRLEALYFLTWESLRISGVEVGEFDAWLATVDDVDASEELSGEPLPPPTPEG